MSVPSGGRRWRWQPRASTRPAAMLVALLVLLACGVGPSHAGRLPRYGGGLQVELPVRPGELGALDPLALWGDDGAILSGCLFEGLTRWGSTRVEPALATQWVRGSEDTRWLFQLRPDAHFHDGARCDAQSVSESLHRLADPRLSSHAWLLRDLVGIEDYVAGTTPQIEGIYVLSAAEIELQFTRPVPDLAARLALPEAAIARRQDTGTVGTGPFHVVAVSPETLRCAAFEQHYAGRPFLATLEFVPEPPPSARGREALTINRLDPTARPAAGGMRVRVPARRLGLALIHPTSSAFADVSSRQRLAAAFDAAVFVRAGLAGDGEPAFGLYPDAATLRSTTGPTAEGKPREATRRGVKILVPAADPVLHKLGERLQAHLSQLGFDVELEDRPSSTYARALRDDRYDIAVLGWTPPQDHAGDLQESSRVLHALGNLLAPALGEHLPPAWRDLLAGRARATEAALMAPGYLVPFVFFHDVWQAPDMAQSLVPGSTSSSMSLADVHLQPSAP